MEMPAAGLTLPKASIPELLLLNAISQTFSLVHRLRKTCEERASITVCW
jgi:hypothetical protein